MEDLKTEMGKGREDLEKSHLPCILASPLCYSQRPHSIYLSTCLPPCKPGCGGLAAVLPLDLLTSVLFPGWTQFADSGLLLSDISQWLLGHQVLWHLFQAPISA